MKLIIGVGGRYAAAQKEEQRQYSRASDL